MDMFRVLHLHRILPNSLQGGDAVRVYDTQTVLFSTKSRQMHTLTLCTSLQKETLSFMQHTSPSLLGSSEEAGQWPGYKRAHFLSRPHGIGVVWFPGRGMGV